jgi:photosystem II stability/assembly factor-like uncharacterized protein
VLDIAFVAGTQMGYAITNDSIYVSTNGGTSWMAEPYTGVTGTATNKALAVLSGNKAFVGGRRFQTGVQDSSPEVYDRRNTGNGYAWGPTTASQFSNMDRLESIAFADSVTGFAGGIQGKLYRMQATLPVITGPWNVNLDLGAGNNQTINSISFVNDSTGMFSTPKQVGANRFSFIYFTSSKGNLWLGPDTITDFLITRLQYVDASHAWAVGLNGKIFSGTNPLFQVNESDLRNQLFIYPNPVSDWLMVKSNNSIVSSDQIKVYTSLGEWLPLKWNEEGQQGFSANVKHLTPGVYFIRFSDDSSLYCFKFLNF